VITFDPLVTDVASALGEMNNTDASKLKLFLILRTDKTVYRRFFVRRYMITSK
jgi:hypothetical protein